jgi:hypothetical protein
MSWLTLRTITDNLPFSSNITSSIVPSTAPFSSLTDRPRKSVARS